jgi:hypothetical protein
MNTVAAPMDKSSGGAEKSFGVTPPSLSLPKGGGAIKGIGEKFAANPVTGTGSMTIPIATSPGRAGFGPQLSLSYDSGAGNGPFGLGWSLSLPAITRKTDKGLPKYQDAAASDVFLPLGPRATASLHCGRHQLSHRMLPPPDRRLVRPYRALVERVRPERPGQAHHLTGSSI